MKYAQSHPWRNTVCSSLDSSYPRTLQDTIHTFETFPILQYGFVSSYRNSPPHSLRCGVPLTPSVLSPKYQWRCTLLVVLDEIYLRYTGALFWLVRWEKEKELSHCTSKTVAPGRLFLCPLTHIKKTNQADTHQSRGEPFFFIPEIKQTTPCIPCNTITYHHRTL